MLGCNISISQEILHPIISKSFGLNHHTNRDIASFSHVDSDKNVIIVGTTEKDSTFTDILTLKLDKENNIIWQKKHSIETNLSYDVPLKSYINSNDEVYILGRSSFNQSTSNGLIFIIKYNKDGNIIYSKTLGDINGTDYVDFAYFDSELNEDGSLSIVYAPMNYQGGTQPLQFKFLKIGSDGEFLYSFSKEIIKQDIIGKIISDFFYFIVTETDSTWTEIKYKIYKIDASGNISVHEINNPDFNKYYASFFYFPDDLKLSINNDNFILVCNIQSQFETKKVVNITKINSNGNVLYSKSTPDNEEYRLVDLYINQQSEAIAVANNLKTNSTQFFKVNDLMQLESIKNVSDFSSTGFKQNDDSSFFLTKSNSSINLFSSDFSFVNSFTNSNTYSLDDFSKIDDNNIVAIGTKFDKMFPESDFFTQLDIIAEKINPTQVTSNFSYSGIGTSGAFQNRIIIDNDNNYLVLSTEKMGPEYLGIGGVDPPISQRIIKYDSNLNIIWKIEVPETIFNIVTPGGRETEYYFDDNNNLYLNLAVSGNYYGLGFNIYKVTPDGSLELFNSSYVTDKFYTNESSILISKKYFLYEDSTMLYILDKSTGNLKQEINLGHEEVIEIFNIGADFYFYTMKKIDNKQEIYLYKNGIKIFSRNIPNYQGNIYPYIVDENGTLYFSNGGTINRLDLNNSFKSYTTGRYSLVKKFNNGNLFIYLDNYNTLILDEKLNFISNGEYIFDALNAYLMPLGNYILFGTSFDGNIRVINQNGYVVKHFKIEGILDKWTSKFDHNGNLIIVGSFGNKIGLNNEYRWSRGFIKNYGQLDLCPNSPPGSAVDIIGCAPSQLDDDKDGVTNDKDLCPNTPEFSFIDSNGCAPSQLDDDKDGITNDKDWCLNTPLGATVDFRGCAILPPNKFTLEITNPTCKNNNGNVKITATESHTYVVTLNNVSSTFTGFSFQQFNLEPKTYNLCIKVPELDNFTQCFEFEIKQPPSGLSARTSLTTKGLITEATIEIDSGTGPFYIEVNGVIEAITHENSINIAVKNGDKIKVKSSLLCEGIYTDNISLLTQLTAYPNPIKDTVEIYLPEGFSKMPLNVQLINQYGKIIYTQQHTISNNTTIQLPMNQFASGVYYIQIITDKIHTLKVIKQ